ncbi:MAG: hypothetical protein ACRDIB_12480 [Ardenticatenaceae bacterium]
MIEEIQGASRIENPLVLPMSLEEFRDGLAAAAREAGVVLDFLMRTWSGRFATYNVGRPTDQMADPRRSADGTARRYKLIGRVKATTRSGALFVTLNPPTSCDPNPKESDQQLWDRFVTTLARQLDL